MLFIGIIGLLTIFFVITSQSAYKLPLWMILVIAIFLRVIVVFLFAGSFSNDNYTLVETGEVFLQHVKIYPALYFPFIIYLASFSVLIGKYIAPFVFLKLVYSMFDVGIVYFVYRLSKDSSKALLYAVNPFTMIVLCIHGQFESIPLFFLLWAIVALGSQREIIASFLLSISVITKDWPHIFLPVFLKRSRRLWVYGLIGILAFLTVLFHWYITGVSIENILRTIESYRGTYTIWGIGSFMATFYPAFWDVVIRTVRRIFLVIFGIWSFFPHKKDFISDLLYTMLTFFVFSPTFGGHWLIWMFPFMVIVKPKGFLVWSFLITIYLGVGAWYEITQPFPKYPDIYSSLAVHGTGMLVWFSCFQVYLGFRKRR